MTNFEAIKNMDVDTMSRFLINPIMCYKPCRYDCDNGYLNSECIDCIREWLEHDAEGWDGLAKGESRSAMPTQPSVPPTPNPTPNYRPPAVREDKVLQDIVAGKGLPILDPYAEFDKDNPPSGIYVWKTR